MRLYFSILLIIVSLSCKNTTEDQPKEKEINKVEQEQKAVVEREEVESNYQYDKEWEVFKEAVINKDIKGVSAFASSDAVDAEFLITVMDNEILLQKLKNTKYEDLEVNETELGVSVEFHAIETTIDEDGNEIGSAITIFFTEGDQFLELDYFVVAG